MTLAVKPLCSLELFDCLDALVSNDTNNDRLAWNNLLESYQVVVGYIFLRDFVDFFQNDGKTKHVFLLSSFFFVQAIACWILLVLCCGWKVGHVFKQNTFTFLTCGVFL